MSKILEYKGVNAGPNSIKDVDKKSGTVIGYFSIFGNVDSDDDVIMPGAFKKSLSENYRRVKHLYQHDTWRPVSGTKKDNLKVFEDTNGLSFESKISATSWGRDLITLYDDGVIDEHSIGFKTIKSNDKGNYRELTELMLWEGSSVTWGANEMARSKSSLTPDELTKKMDSVMKSIRSGKYENDEIFENLEYYFKQLQQLFIDLSQKAQQSDAEATQPAKKAVEPVKSKRIVECLKAFNKTLITEHEKNVSAVP